MSSSSAMPKEEHAEMQPSPSDDSACLSPRTMIKRSTIRHPSLKTQTSDAEAAPCSRSSATPCGGSPVVLLGREDCERFMHGLPGDSSQQQLPPKMSMKHFVSETNSVLPAAKPESGGLPGRLAPSMITMPSADDDPPPQDRSSSMQCTASSQIEPTSANSAKSLDSLASPMSPAFSSMPSLRAQDSVGERGDSVAENYETLEVLGQGGFGIVYKVRCKRTAAIRAMKSIPFANISKMGTRFEAEMNVAKRLKHPNVMRVLEVFKGDDVWSSLHLLTEIYTGQDLLNYLQKNPFQDCGLGTEFVLRGLGSEETGMYVWQMLSGVGYLHHHNIAHRDIKAENYMFETPNEQAPLKLVDFGLARFFEKGMKMHSSVGTSYTMAPEVIEGSPYDEKCDIWSVGITAYMMSVGYPPFLAKTDEETYELVTKGGDLEFEQRDWNRHAKDLRAIVTHLLTRDPTTRPSARSAAYGSKWLQAHKSAQPGCCCVIA